MDRTKTYWTGDQLQIVRQAYAKQIAAAAGVTLPNITQAFAAVPREHYLGQGPWPVLRGRNYTWTPDADPVYLYTNDIIGILPRKQINNGQPSLHARLMAAANPRPGDHIVHIGIGSGYYTAILAELTGPSGRVTAVELDNELAKKAKINLRSYKNVRVYAGDGTTFSVSNSNVIYVNAGANDLPPSWLDGLADGGRLILPLTTENNFQLSAHLPHSQGAVFCVERRNDIYPTRWVTNVSIIPCAGARDEVAEQALVKAFTKGNGTSVGGLVRRGDLPEEHCWLRTHNWCLVLDKYWTDAQTSDSRLG